jgi:hypothetical protein
LTFGRELRRAICGNFTERSFGHSDTYFDKKASNRTLGSERVEKATPVKGSKPFINTPEDERENGKRRR